MKLFACKKCGLVFDDAHPPIKVDASGLCQHEKVKEITKDTRGLTFDQINSLIVRLWDVNWSGDPIVIEEDFFGFEKGTPASDVVNTLFMLRNKAIDDIGFARTDVIGCLIDIVTDFVEKEKNPFEALTMENSAAYDYLAEEFKKVLNNFGLLPSLGEHEEGQANS